EIRQERRTLQAFDRIVIVVAATLRPPPVMWAERRHQTASVPSLDAVKPRALIWKARCEGTGGARAAQATFPPHPTRRQDGCQTEKEPGAGRSPGPGARERTTTC